MYATIPEDAEAKQPNQAPAARRGFVALCVGVIIGALGTIALIGGPEAPSPSRAAMELDQTPNAYLTPGQYHECHLMVDKALNDQYDKMSKDCKSEWG